MTIIDFGSLELRFLANKNETGGSLDIFEMTLRPQARMPVPHHHERWDETIYGLTGTSTWTVDGQSIAVGHGDSVFIRRGVVHGFTNETTSPATCLCILTPGILGTTYFEEMGALLAGRAPDVAAMRETMLRHGLVPAAS